MQVQHRFSSVLNPSAAGRFYPANPTQLQDEVRQAIQTAACDPAQSRVFAVLVPHAGYVFSAPVAGYSFKHISNQNVDTVLFIALSHKGVQGACVFSGRAMQTPLGEIETDEELTSAFLQIGEPFYTDMFPYQGEHSIEVNLPFVQTVFPLAKTASILTSHLQPDVCRRIGKGIADTLGLFPRKNILICLSSDLSHFPTYEEAVRLDQAALAALETVNPKLFMDSIQHLENERVPNLHCVMCGSAPALCVLETATELGISQAKVLRYQNSGDSAFGEKDRVVGYGSAALYYPAETDESLTDAEKKELLTIARESIKARLKNESYTPRTDSAMLLQENGLFITLKHKGELRGCLGRFDAAGCLLKDLAAQLAADSATGDSRFTPITLSELPDTSISISVLSPESKINGPEDILIGKHGIKIIKGTQSGTLLPQVASERDWDALTFLQHTCTKADLMPDAWKDTATDIYVYEAEVFSDTEFTTPPFKGYMV